MTLQLLTSTAMHPPRWLIHGQPGVGKSTFATRSKNPAVLETEDGGCPAGVPTFGHLKKYEQVTNALSQLATEEHDRETVIIDDLDSLEVLIHREVCAENNWPSVEHPGYGRGYVACDALWLNILAGLDYLRTERGMTVILLAHSAIETVNDPRAPAYNSYQLRLHKRGRALVQDRVDIIGFLSTDLHVQSEDAGFGKKRHRAADGGSTRWLHVEGRPAFVAKNRYSLPARIQIPKDLNYDATFASYLPQPQRG